MRKLKYYYHVFMTLRKLDLERTLEYRGNFIFWAFIALMWTLFQFFFYSVLIGVTGEIGGWTKPELFVLVSVYTIIDAFTWSFLFHNMSAYTTSVYNGELNLTLTRPINTQYLIMTNHASYTNVTRLITGVVMLIISLSELGSQLYLSDILIGSIFIVVAVLFIYFFWFMIATLCLYVERLDEINDMVPALRRIWAFPRTIYSGVFSFVFTILLPLGLASSIPAESFIHKFSFPTALYLCFFVLGLIFTSNRFFKYSLKRYNSVGN